MPYTPDSWANNDPSKPLNAARLTKLGSQYGEVMGDLPAKITDPEDPIGSALSGTIDSVVRARVVVNAADEQFGTTRDQAQINAAVTYVEGLGGGQVDILSKDGPWTLGRSVIGDQKKGGIYVTGRNVTLRADGTVFTLTNNCDFVRASSVLGTQVTITANTAVTDTILEVTSSASFTVGGDVFVRLGQAAYDAFEPDFWLFAKVAAITDGTHITLDRPVGYAMSVAGTTSVAQRSVAPFTSLVENFRMEGTFTFVNPAAGAANAEGGIRLDHVKGFSFDVIDGTDCGAGVLNTHFLDGGTGRRLIAPSAIAQNGQASKGRIGSWSETRGLYIDVIEAENFRREAVIVEGRAEGVRIEKVVLRNNNVDREATTPLFATLGNSKLSIGSVHVTGAGTAWHSTGGSTGNRFDVDEAFFYTSARPSIPDLSQIRRLFHVDGVMYGPARTYRQVIPLTPGMSGAVIDLPAGYLRGVRAHATSVTGITSFILGATGTASSNLVSSLVAGSTVTLGTQASGFGSAYNASANTGKRVLLSTDSTVPPGARLFIEVDYFPDPASVSDSELAWMRNLPAETPSIVIQAEEMAAITGAPTLATSAGRWRVWNMDQTTQERVTGVVRIPSDWNSCRLDLYWANASSGSGDVRWNAVLDATAVGATLNASGTSADATAAAGAQDILVRTSVGTFTVDPTKLHNLRISRDAASGADTLGNDASLVAAMLVKVS